MFGECGDLSLCLESSGVVLVLNGLQFEFDLEDVSVRVLCEDGDLVGVW